MTTVTENTFKELINFSLAQEHVKQTLNEIKGDGEKIVRFFARYTAWNAMFAGGVAQLVANIARNGWMFNDKTAPKMLADRSNYIASFFFDAARDEFDDHTNRQRDPHRSMAQAMLVGMSQFYKNRDVLEEETPYWLVDLVEVNTMRGYHGGFDSALIAEQDKPYISQTPAAEMVFHGIGYHLGSELLADQEFSIIDKHLRDNEPALVKHLLHAKISLADADHRCYAWIGVHSGHGGGAEADHFAWALEGVNKALELVDADKTVCLNALKAGFINFGHDHFTFFNKANT